MRGDWRAESADKPSNRCLDFLRDCAAEVALALELELLELSASALGSSESESQVAEAEAGKGERASPSCADECIGESEGWPSSLLGEISMLMFARESAAGDGQASSRAS